MRSIHDICSYLKVSIKGAFTCVVFVKFTTNRVKLLLLILIVALPSWTARANSMSNVDQSATQSRDGAQGKMSVARGFHSSSASVSNGTRCKGMPTNPGIWKPRLCIIYLLWKCFSSRPLRISGIIYGIGHARNQNSSLVRSSLKFIHPTENTSAPLQRKTGWQKWSLFVL
jgi:hypothetical protein